MELSKFETPASAREGQWFEVCLFGGRYVALTPRELRDDPDYRGATPAGTEDKPVRIKLASMDTLEYDTAVRSAMFETAAEGMNRGQRRKAKRGGKLSQALTAEKQIEAEDEALAEHVILDWTGFEENGQALPCTHDAKRKALGIKWFRDMVTAAAADMADATEADLGNSASTPGASSS